jgi:tetratricopeptide (TPR) repeat protein
MQPPRYEEAIRFYTTAVALRPQYPSARANLGLALKEVRPRRLEEAIAEMRQAIQLDPQLSRAHNNLATALWAARDPKGAIESLRKAIETDPKNSRAYYNLGLYQNVLGKHEDAIAAYLQAIQLDSMHPWYHNNLGAVLMNKARIQKDKVLIDQAIVRYQKAISLKRDFAEAHFNLSLALSAKGARPEAIAEARLAIHHKKDFADAHYNLANWLREDSPEAIEAYENAIRFKNDYAEAYCNLGRMLLRRGQFQRAVEMLRRGHQLGTSRKDWRYRSDQWLARAERLLRLDQRVSAVLEGKDRPKDAGERLAFAEYCYGYRKHLTAAARWCAEAFAEQPALFNLTTHHRRNAARVAILAASQKDPDTAGRNKNEPAQLRRQALDWLQAELAAWNKALERDADKVRAEVVEEMTHWLTKPDFAGVRGPEVRKLPEAERSAWQKLWADVEDLLARAKKKTVPEEKPGTK